MRTKHTHTGVLITVFYSKLEVIFINEYAITYTE